MATLPQPHLLGKEYLGKESVTRYVDIAHTFSHNNINLRQTFPPGTFVTCSADSTIRFWHLDGIVTSEGQRNVFSKEILRTIYVNDDYSFMKARDYSGSKSEFYLFS